MDRRDFIRKAAAGSAAVAVGGAALLEGCSGGKTGSASAGTSGIDKTDGN